MGKYYRVVKDHPMWEVGAILENKTGNYYPISDVWDKHDFLSNGWHEGAELVEKSDWFERVYEISILGKAKYLTKDGARQAHDQLFEGK